MTSGHPTPHKPAELFRADLISAMKLPDSMPLDSGSFLAIKEPWRTEWEVGVQVCVSPDHILEASTRAIENPPAPPDEMECSQRYIHEEDETSGYVMYDLDELDLHWLQSVNTKRKFRALAGTRGLEEDVLREALLMLETKCQQSMARAVATEETLGIEYDEQTMCDVCRDHESEDTNDMIFCDSCNVCVHQACYGVPTIPKGEWLCKVCAVGDDQATCVLCPVKGGALKRVRPGNTSWAHLCCALWIPEVRVGNADRMEPITNVDAIPSARRNLVCCICKRRIGACIKCSHPLCATAYHVTCGFQHGLDMKSRLDMATNSVIHESYCPRHTAMRKSPTKQSVTSSHYRNHLTRPSQLVQLQEAFYNYASVEDLVTKLHLPPKVAALVYNYWKLKRKSQHNRPLLSHLPIETSLESIKAELAAGGIKYGEGVDENFLKIVHLRHNLEKARNLIYMVQKRERLKKQLLQMQWDMVKMKTSFHHEHVATVAAPTAQLSTVKDRSSSEPESLSDADVPTPRQTRSMTHQAVSCTNEQVLPSAATLALNNIDHGPHENHKTSHSPPPPTPDAYPATNGPGPHSKQRFRVRTSDRGNKFESLHSDNEASFSRTLRSRELKGIGKSEHVTLASSIDPTAMDGTLQRIQRLNSLKPLGSTTNGGIKASGNVKRIGGSRGMATENHRKVNSEVSLDVPWDLMGAAAAALSKDDSHLLRSRTASSPRVRPYIINHKATDKAS